MQSVSFYFVSLFLSLFLSFLSFFPFFLIFKAEHDGRAPAPIWLMPIAGPVYGVQSEIHIHSG